MYRLRTAVPNPVLHQMRQIRPLVGSDPDLEDYLARAICARVDEKVRQQFLLVVARRPGSSRQ